ncbi:MAG TPA: hypothetical protein VJS19_00150 [Candidatus Dormibacteraeota bacterium]|nr:hypothetical protein [Candidatus Dormibacteraeota bacterium]
MNEGQQRHGAWSGLSLRRRLDGLQVAAFSAVDDVPSGSAQLPANRVGLGKLALAPQSNATLEKLLG